MTTYEISADSEDPVEDIRKQLDSLPISEDDVTKMKVVVEVGQRVVAPDQQTLDEVKPAVQPSEVDYGPVPESERNYTAPPSKKSPSMGNREHYHGNTEEDAVMPDTIHADVLQAVDGRWMTSVEAHEFLNDNSDEDYNFRTIASYLSEDFNKRGFVKRRGDQAPFEYALDLDGKEALRRGLRAYEESLEEEEELDEAVEITIDTEE